MQLTTENDELSLAWFGESWGAPVCNKTHKEKIPVGLKCYHCGQLITEDDSGFLIADLPSEVKQPWHVSCLLLYIGVR